MAAKIKSSSLEFEEAHTDYWNAFNRPVLVSEMIAENIQSHWVRQMVTMNETEYEYMVSFSFSSSIPRVAQAGACYVERIAKRI